MNTLTFTCIDFETANESRDSICQVGIARVENGEMVFLDSFLVQPPKNEYSHWNVCIHGISPDQTFDKPFFPEIWERIKIYFENQLIVAHNAEFDIDCLIKTLNYYKIPLPNYRQECTYIISGLNLVDLCESLDIQIISHHNAMYDALACSESYIKLKTGYIPDLTKITQKESKSIFEGHERLSGQVLKPDLEHSDSNSPFYGKKVVFTGVLNCISREEAANKVKELGADIDTGISKKTDYVIVGAGAVPSKLKKIQDYNNNGSNIKIIKESEFLNLIKHGL
jgi:DNA polymerase III subunit epsilon